MYVINRMSHAWMNRNNFCSYIKTMRKLLKLICDAKSKCMLLVKFGWKRVQN